MFPNTIVLGRAMNRSTLSKEIVTWHSNYSSNLSQINFEWKKNRKLKIATDLQQWPSQLQHWQRRHQDKHQCKQRNPTCQSSRGGLRLHSRWGPAFQRWYWRRAPQAECNGTKALEIAAWSSPPLPLRYLTLRFCSLRWNSLQFSKMVLQKYHIEK